jgi:hypothetical protein
MQRRGWYAGCSVGIALNEGITNLSPARGNSASCCIIRSIALFSSHSPKKMRVLPWKQAGMLLLLLRLLFLFP